MADGVGAILADLATVVVAVITTVIYCTAVIDLSDTAVVIGLTDTRQQQLHG